MDHNSHRFSLRDLSHMSKGMVELHKPKLLRVKHFAKRISDRLAGGEPLLETLDRRSWIEQAHAANAETQRPVWAKTSVNLKETAAAQNGSLQCSC